jgi:hypothetical protein
MAKKTPEVLSDGRTIDERNYADSLRTQRKIHQHIKDLDCIEVFVPEYDTEGKLVGKFWRIVSKETYQTYYAGLPTRPLTLNPKILKK